MWLPATTPVTLLLVVDYYFKADLLGLDDYLLDSDLSKVYVSYDVDLCWDRLKGVIKDARFCFILQITIPSNSSPRWFTAEIRHYINKVCSLQKLT